jgi:hypothetical protein
VLAYTAVTATLDNMPRVIARKQKPSRILFGGWCWLCMAAMPSRQVAPYFAACKLLLADHVSSRESLQGGCMQLWVLMRSPL